MTPGEYLRACRETAGVSIERIVARVGTVPYAMAEHERRAWLHRIERDDAPITGDVFDAYRALVGIDDALLARLILIHSGLALRRAAPPAGVLELTTAEQLPPAAEDAA